MPVSATSSTTARPPPDAAVRPSPDATARPLPGAAAIPAGQAASARTRTVTAPPGSVNFTALLVRFASTRRSFSQSPMISGTSGSTRVEKATSFLRATGSMADSTIPTKSLRSISSTFSVSEPA